MNCSAAWLQDCSGVAAAVVMKDMAWPAELSNGGTCVMVGLGGDVVLACHRELRATFVLSELTKWKIGCQSFR